MTTLNRSLRRGLELLRVFNRLRTPSLTELATATGMSKPTVLRYMRTLEEEGYVALDEGTKRYRLTPTVFELGYAALSSMEFPRLAEPFMDALALDLGLTTNLARRDGAEIVMVGRTFAAKEKYKYTPIRAEVGDRLPALVTALGRVLVAAEPDCLDDVLRTLPVAKLTPKTVTDPARLREMVEAAAKQGYAVVEEELVLGYSSLAIGLEHHGRERYALGVTVPSADYPRKRLVGELLPRLEAVRAQLCPAHSARVRVA